MAGNGASIARTPQAVVVVATTTHSCSRGLCGLSMAAIRKTSCSSRSRVSSFTRWVRNNLDANNVKERQEQVISRFYPLNLTCAAFVAPWLTSKSLNPLGICEAWAVQTVAHLGVLHARLVVRARAKAAGACGWSTAKQPHARLVPQIHRGHEHAQA